MASSSRRIFGSGSGLGAGAGPSSSFVTAPPTSSTPTTDRPSTSMSQLTTVPPPPAVFATAQNGRPRSRVYTPDPVFELARDGEEGWNSASPSSSSYAVAKKRSAEAGSTSAESGGMGKGKDRANDVSSSDVPSPLSNEVLVRDVPETHEAGRSNGEGERPGSRRAR